LINKVGRVFFNLTEANTNDELQAIAKEISPKLSLHLDEIYLNEKLFEKVKAVYQQKEKLNLNSEQAKLLEETYKQFVRSGANLPKEKKEEMKKINEELSILTLQFGDNVLAETNNFKLVIDNKRRPCGTS
jgi:peptidyl-dipeptidase Dcp